MKEIKRNYPIEFDVFASKAGVQVLKMYELLEEVEDSFGELSVEVNANVPFLAGLLHKERYGGLIIAPAASNTVAKIANCIGDILLTNSALQALKAYRPVYVMPVGLEAGESTTTLPDGTKIKIRVRKEDAAQAAKLREIDGITVLEGPEGIEDEDEILELVGGRWRSHPSIWR